MSVFVHAQGIKTVHAGGGVKKWQNSVHVVVECPLTMIQKQKKFPMETHKAQKQEYQFRKTITPLCCLYPPACKLSSTFFSTQGIQIIIRQNIFMKNYVVACIPCIVLRGSVSCVHRTYNSSSQEMTRSSAVILLIIIYLGISYYIQQ